MKYWIHPTRGVFHKNAVYFNPGMPYPMPDNEPPLPGSFETDEKGNPKPPKPTRPIVPPEVPGTLPTTPEVTPHTAAQTKKKD